MGHDLLLMKKPALDGEMKIVYSVDWGDVGEVSKTITNPTWIDIWVACDELIRLSGDHHHVFIEDILYNEESDTWSLLTGS